jgi:hypothetical protein
MMMILGQADGGMVSGPMIVAIIGALTTFAGVLLGMRMKSPWEKPVKGEEKPQGLVGGDEGSPAGGRVYTPPSFYQHRQLEARVVRLEMGIEELRKDQAEKFTQLLQAGQERADRLIDKMDDVARAYHSRVDQLMQHAPPPPPPTRPPNRKP